MAIPEAWESETSSQEPENGPNYERPRPRAHAGAGEYTADHGPASEGNVVPLRHLQGQLTEGDQEADKPSTVVEPSKPGLPAKLRTASGVWWSEAVETGTAALDGSVWRARPPALRDIHVRAQRADYAGDLSILRAVGVGFGWVSVVVTALGYALLWVARRPSRLAVATAVVILIVVLAI